MNGKYFDHSFFDKTDSELHDIIYSGHNTDLGFIDVAIEEQRYRRAIKSLNSFAGFLDAEIMKLLKREDVFPSDINRKIREEAVKRKLVAPRLYIEDLHKQSYPRKEIIKDISIRYRSLIYNEIKDPPKNSPKRRDETKITPPSAYIPPVNQQRRENQYPNTPPPRRAIQNPNSPPPGRANQNPNSPPPGRANQYPNTSPPRRTTTDHRSNYWSIKIGKYILIMASLALLFLIIDILQPDLKTHILRNSDTSLLNNLEKPITKIGNKLGIKNGNLSQSDADRLLREKYQFDIMAFPLFDGSPNKEATKVRYDRLQNEGLINYSNCGEGGNSGYCATLTEKGKTFAVSESYKDELDNINYINVRSTILEVGEIKSIKEATAFEGFEVAFTIKVVATPFGAIWSNFSPGILNKTEMFEKHGEEWRIRTM